MCTHTHLAEFKQVEPVTLFTKTIIPVNRNVDIMVEGTLLDRRVDKHLYVQLQLVGVRRDAKMED